MAEQVETCVKNFIRLKVLMTQACVTLRKIFRERWESFAGEAWINSPTSGHQFITTLGRNVYRIANEQQRKCLENGDINTWDLFTLSNILLQVDCEKENMAMENENVEKEKTCIRELVSIQSKLTLDPTETVTEKEVITLWRKVVPILVHFGHSEDKLEELRIAENIEHFNFGTRIFVNAVNAKEADRLKEKGNVEFKAGNLDIALQHYTEAIILSDISDQVLATLFCNRAAVHINTVEKLLPAQDEKKNLAKDNALSDAKIAVDLHPNWWKAHFRLGKVFEKMGELKKAAFAFDCAVVLNPGDEELKKTRDNCRHNLSESEVRELLCPTRLYHTFEKPFIKKLTEEGTVALKCMNRCKEAEKLLAKKGDPRAYHLEAHRLRYGLDGKPNFEKIANLYEKAARKGSAEAMYNLAIVTKQGQGVTKDIKRAIALFKQAANEPLTVNGFPNPGVAEAEYEIGLLYMDGNGLQLNPEVGIQWLQRACEHGSGYAANFLGQVYLNGLGVNIDDRRAVEFWKLAASRKVVESMESLYGYFLKELNPEQAQKWFTEALDNGSTKAKENRKQIQEQMRKIPMKTEILEVAKWEKENKLDAGELPLIKRYLRMENDVNPKGKYFVDQLMSQLMKVNNLNLPYGGGSKSINLLQIKEMAEKGSKAAQKFHSASVHFDDGIALLKTGTAGIAQAIHHFAECYRIEAMVARWSAEIQNVFLELVENLLRDTTARNEISSLDRDLHVCYAYLTE